MTSKIEVSRELLEELLDGADSMGWSIAEVIRDMLAAPEAPRQSPIGWFTDDYLTDKSATTYDELTSNRWKDKGWPVQPLYAAPLSPDHSGGGAGMVLPERKEALNVIGSAYDDGICEGWNACLDKVKELNQ